MSIVTWSNEYETGIAEIDGEHQRLFALVNEIHDAHKQDEEFPINAVMIELADYVTYHFRREETLMASCNYEWLNQHKEEHHKLEEIFMTYREDFEKQPKKFDVDGFVKFLTRWLSRHIIQSDMDYVPAIKNKLPENE